MKQCKWKIFFKLKQISTQHVIPILFPHRSYESAYESELNIQPCVQLVIKTTDLQCGKDLRNFPPLSTDPKLISSTETNVNLSKSRGCSIAYFGFPAERPRPRKNEDTVVATLCPAMLHVRGTVARRANTRTVSKDFHKRFLVSRTQNLPTQQGPRRGNLVHTFEFF